MLFPAFVMLLPPGVKRLLLEGNKNSQEREQQHLVELRTDNLSLAARLNEKGGWGEGEINIG